MTEAFTPAAKRGSVRLERVAFRTSRLLDFVGRRELTAQIGHAPDVWPLVIMKELVDNAIDACEEAEIAPEIEVRVDTDTGDITVADNGPGIRPETVVAILDYSVRVSSREAYVSPTRGQQGNALMTLVAMPFALDSGKGETIIDTRGIEHRIVFAADQVRQEPKIDHRTTPSQIVRNGTCVTIRWPRTACGYLENAHTRFLQMAAEYVFLNPNLTFRLYRDKEKEINAQASAPGWQKWRACDPTSAHWYDPARLARYAAALVNHDDHNQARERTVREFLDEFRGLAGSAKQKQVLEASGMARLPLSALFKDGLVDLDRVSTLLDAMCECTRPVRPRDLGVIGAEHWARWCAALDGRNDTFRYRCIAEEDEQGIPYVVEAAFCARSGEDIMQRAITGFNFSPALGNPFRSFNHEYGGLETLLAEQRCGGIAPIVFVLHLTGPGIGFRDRGKTSLVLGQEIIGSITTAVEHVTGPWAKQHKAAERDSKRARRALEKQEAAAARRAAAVEPKRAKSTVVGSGMLYQEIDAAAARSRRSVKELTVLTPQKDPYRLDTTTGHELGQWLADQIARLVGPDGRVHLRGLFYRIVAAGDVTKPDGEVFANTNDNWVWLSTRAAKAARWLGYVPFYRIRDERNDGPRVFLPDIPGAGEGSFARGSYVDIPVLSTLLPYLSVIAPRGAQPYRIVFLGEKSSLADVLAPIAQEVHGELLLPAGETTDTMIAEMAQRAAADGRPAVVLYFADFDPAGFQMPISVSRKLQALRTLLFPKLDIELHRVALTSNQVREFNLPSTPLKDTEKRKTRWREIMQHEQTEIDALAALRPDDLADIAREAVAPFFDFTLDQRCRQAAAAWHAEAEAKLADHPDVAVMQNRVAAARDVVTKAISRLHTVQSRTYGKLRRKLEIADTPIPAPEAQIEAPAPAPLFTTADDFAVASLKLIADKRYEGEEDEDA